MLRTLVLLVTHLTMLGSGGGLALLAVRGRRQAIEARAAALDVHAMFLDDKADRLAGAPVGRHRAPLVKSAPGPSLLTASLSEATAILGTHRAQRVQERRQFVDLMTSLAGPARIRQHVTGRASVA